MEQPTLKTAVITGGSSGIGLELCYLLTQNDYFVINLDKQKPLEKTAIGKNCTWISCDVSQPRKVAEAFKRVKLLAPKIDAAVLNAGEYRMGSLSMITEADLKSVFSTNVFGCIYVMQELLPLLKVSKSPSIVFVASDQAKKGKAHSLAYGMSKASVVQLAQTLARELAPQIRVNCVCPGAINTPLYEKAISEYASVFSKTKNTKDVHKQVMSHYPMKRIGKPNEVAEAILFLLSEKAAFITGSVLSIDGGLTA